MATGSGPEFGLEAHHCGRLVAVGFLGLPAGSFGSGGFAAAGVSAAIFFIILALGCYFASEIVRLGLYYATLLEDIRNRL